jgi:hypothetical protein
MRVYASISDVLMIIGVINLVRAGSLVIDRTIWLLLYSVFLAAFAFIFLWMLLFSVGIVSGVIYFHAFGAPSLLVAGIVLLWQLDPRATVYADHNDEDSRGVDSNRSRL